MAVGIDRTTEPTIPTILAERAKAQQQAQALGEEYQQMKERLHQGRQALQELQMRSFRAQNEAEIATCQTQAREFEHALERLVPELQAVSKKRQRAEHTVAMVEYQLKPLVQRVRSALARWKDARITSETHESAQERYQARIRQSTAYQVLHSLLGDEVMANILEHNQRPDWLVQR